MAKDGHGIEPQWITGRSLAAATPGWTTAYAEDILEQLWLRGMAEKEGGQYRITGRGLAMGEKMGVTIDFNDLIVSPGAKN